MSESNVFGQPDRNWKKTKDPLERSHGENPYTYKENPYKAMTGVDFSEEKLVDNDSLSEDYDQMFPKNVVTSYATKNDAHAEQTERRWRLVNDGDPLDDVDYKFNEDKNIKELKRYIDGTYQSHYSKNKFQSTEFIVDCGHGDGFCLGNIIKYAQRYGKKNGKDRKDLLKIMHYAIIALSILDNEDK